MGITVCFLASLIFSDHVPELTKESIPLPVSFAQLLRNNAKQIKNKNARKKIKRKVLSTSRVIQYNALFKSYDNFFKHD